MQISMLRPVGSRVPNPVSGAPSESLSWDERYHTEFVDSGTSALSLAIALSIAANDLGETPEVILPAYGCPDLVSAVLFQGAKPVLVDLGNSSPCLSLGALKQALTDNTVAVIAVDLLGFHENLEGIKAVLDGTGVWLIEDSAQAFPPSSSGSGIADCIVLSFGRGKPINLMGGGALLIRRDRTQSAKAILQSLPKRRISTGATWRSKRFIFNLLLSRLFYGLLARIPFLGFGKTEFVPLGSITSLEIPPVLIRAGVSSYHKRAYFAGLYLESLAFLEDHGWSGPRELTKACVECSDSDPLPRLLRFPLLAPSVEIRDQAVFELQQAGICANSLYGAPLPGIRGLQSFFGRYASDFPNARAFSRHLILLPLHEDVRRHDIEHAAKILKSISAPN
ncbi:DegT/DnrJ/EryC1/StrS aminotransferase family protein [Marinobacter nanhaiticus D15-8W]|uniref:DegT/DnrJ/EryC1/StrS aminotransferase family protein n=1 Tax=Marinobacter nanhaiticus D15-8W TaxID=626887 RepID=N6VVT3_9GAMM|nr:DegT/DnrJ/EryC1/StrS family aminotransferase [Marinobacter nanhaiticus]ENO14290.2 DegT/DnrJ/EryC1/StrS aminotransferase family protein [Marinobacter nanhaiticus D15-8W]